MKPRKINKTSANELSIDWDDGHNGIHSFRVLRKYCPCASCKMEIEASEGNVLLPILTPGQFELRSIEPVGSYALQFIWGMGTRQEFTRTITCVKSASAKSVNVKQRNKQMAVTW